MDDPSILHDEMELSDRQKADIMGPPKSAL
jgi:hypothetical protein